MVICAAVKYEYLDIETDKKESIVLTGLRHCDCMRIHQLYVKHHESKLLNTIQGFINDKNKFLTRKEALDEFKKCNQGETRFNELYSEDLY